MLVRRLIKIFTSLRLTVVLLAFAIVLIFLGTLGQEPLGLYFSQKHFFKSCFVDYASVLAALKVGLQFVGLQLTPSTPEDVLRAAWIPILPGGYLIGILLLINLLAAHIYRFQFSVKKIGIQFVHAGVILFLVGQLVTDRLAHETQMRFSEGETKKYSESTQDYELIFATATTGNMEKIISIPASLLARGGTIENTNLPFTIQVKEYWKNSEPAFRAPMMQNGPPLAPNGVALNFDFHQVAEAKSMDDKNVPTALIELSSPNGSLGDWVVSDWTDDGSMIEAIRENYEQQLGGQMTEEIVKDLTRPQSVSVGGNQFTFSIRPSRNYFPFSLTLLKATHTVYEGTDIPKDFRSRVQLRNPQTGENREVEISMNHPLRYAGLTFYQYQMDAGQAAAQAGRAPSSVLQVVHNPGWLTPYLGCGMVAAGLVIQFMFHLVGFITKRK